MFKVGDKVKFKDFSGMAPEAVRKIIKDRIYTIKNIRYTDVDLDTRIELVEIPVHRFYPRRFLIINQEIPKTELEYYKWLSERK